MFNRPTAFNPWVQPLRIANDLPSSTHHLVFQFSVIPYAVTEACPPRHRIWDTSLFLYADYSIIYFVCQTRADIRVRVRCIVIRIRVRNTTIRIRVVVATIDHTTIGERYLCLAKILIFSKFFDGLTPVFGCFQKREQNALRFVASLPLSLYATSTAALKSATLSATSISPLKARREPIPASAYDAPLFACAYATPPFAYAWLNPR